MAIDPNGQERSNDKIPLTGNASNPSPHNPFERDNDEHLLSNKAGKYIRETASIEDVPDAQDQQDMDEILKQNNKEK